MDADLVDIKFNIVTETDGFVDVGEKSAIYIKDEELKTDETIELCVVQCTVRRGRAPIYFTNEKGANAKAFMRRV